MPAVKDYDHKKKAHKKTPPRPRRRPGRESTARATTAAKSAAPAEEMFDETAHHEVSEDQLAFDSEEMQRKPHIEPELEDEDTTHRIRLDFPYSDLIRARAPKAFDLAESVAGEWKNNGDFRDLPVGHPLARLTVGIGLRKAKAVEKKLDETGLLSMARMGVEFAKSKLKK